MSAPADAGLAGDRKGAPMWRGVLGLLVMITGVLALLAPAPAHSLPAHSLPAQTLPAQTQPAQTLPAQTGGEVVLYFFWGEGCPHCAAAKPFLAELQQRYPELIVRDFEIYNSLDNQKLFVALAAAAGTEPSGVPTFFLGEDHWVGYGSSTGALLEEAVAQCLATGCADAGAGIVPGAAERPEPGPAASGAEPGSAASGAGTVDLPLIGETETGTVSLALATALIALVDGVNPCSLWVLSVLLALTLRTGSRRVTLTIGLVFITVTALVYALFIAGLFTVLTVTSFAPWVRVLVAFVALVFAAVNIKDYFWFRQGVSLTIPESAKPGIYQRIRGVLERADSPAALVTGTAVLAAGVSFVELACTAGFPVLWTNLLTAREVTPLVFVALLLLYMAIYQLDELVLFGVAVTTMRVGKLQERHGRILKLVGGMLMLTLALVMLVRPEWMSDVRTSLLVFGVAAGATLLVLLVHRVVLPRVGVRIGSEEKPPLVGRDRRR